MLNAVIESPPPIKEYEPLFVARATTMAIFNVPIEKFDISKTPIESFQSMVDEFSIIGDLLKLIIPVNVNLNLTFTGIKFIYSQ